AARKAASDSYRYHFIRQTTAFKKRCLELSQPNKRWNLERLKVPDTFFGQWKSVLRKKPVDARGRRQLPFFPQAGPCCSSQSIRSVTKRPGSGSNSSVWCAPAYSMMFRSDVANC